MRTVNLNVYKFSELSTEAQKTAISKLSAINTEYHNWWESTYEDAKTIGIKITSFDIDRINDITGSLIDDEINVAELIFDNHGTECSTYKIADTFKEEYYKPDIENLEQLEKDFLRDILKEYHKILKNEYEYLQSDEAIKNTIESNDYEFLENGEIYN